MDEHEIQGEFALESERNNIENIGLRITFRGLKSAGTNAFISTHQLFFNFDNFRYWVGPDNLINEIWVEKKYDESWSDLELVNLVERWVHRILNLIQRDVENTSRPDPNFLQQL